MTQEEEAGEPLVAKGNATLYSDDGARIGTILAGTPYYQIGMPQPQLTEDGWKKVLHIKSDRHSYADYEALTGG